jgi:hypothetical protein
MKDLIKALLIFSKYNDGDNIHCEHDELFVCIDPTEVSAEDLKRLDELSFRPNSVDGFSSFRFGSC